MADGGGTIAPPAGQQRRVQGFAAQQLADQAPAGEFGLVGFGQNALLVIGGEVAALGMSGDFGIGAGGGKTAGEGRRRLRFFMKRIFLALLSN